MKRLEILKGLAALSVLATAYNTHFDLIGIPRLWELHLALSFLCILLFLAGVYHDQLSRKLMEQAQREEHRSYDLNPLAAQELIFREALIAFLLFIPVIPALLRFPGEPYLGLSLLLFPVHGLIRSIRTRAMKGMSLIIGEHSFAYPLRSTRSIRYEELDRIEVKYGELFFIRKDGRVDTFPLEFLSEGRERAIEHLQERLASYGVKGSGALQELFSSRASKV